MRTPANPPSDPPWLPDVERRWLAEHQAALDRIFAAFHASGEWPDPVQLQRELRARGEDIDLISAVQDLPPLLGRRSWSPAQVELSLFGVACCSASRRLLSRLVAVIQLALARFDAADSPNRLCRADVDRALVLQPVEADRLSKLILLDSFFLGGGDANLDSWDQPVSEGVLKFEGVEDADELMARLAEIRRVDRSPSIPPLVEDVPTARPLAGADPPPATDAHGGATAPRKRSFLSRLRPRKFLSPQGILGALILSVIAGWIVWATTEGPLQLTGTNHQPPSTRTQPTEAPPTGSGPQSSSAQPDLGSTIKLGCPAPPGPENRPSLTIRVVQWCALPGVRGQAQLKFKMQVQNTGKSILDIGRKHWYLLVTILDPWTWTPPTVGAPTSEVPLETTYRDHSVWAVPANADDAFDYLPDQPSVGTFATHWTDAKLTPGQTFPASGDDDVLVFYLPTAGGDPDSARGVIGVAYLAGEDVIVACPPEEWGPQVSANDF